ncbi:MAG: hypothetical protein JO007_13945 [Alphaproteobacteria bacterium]|nr:hypothetical protein [Alphaproteobacteria bacterium]
MPLTDTYLLFPYTVLGNRVALIDAETMRTDYPKAWSYLKSYRDVLRLREARRDSHGRVVEAPFDDEAWYRFGRHQNLDKQEIVKLVVPRLVANLGCSVDEDGSLYLDNVDVGGVVIADIEDPFFIAGVLNSPVGNFIFKRISKPFRGGFLSANKQYIAPLPIPPASAEERSRVSVKARALQMAHTARRDTLVRIARRLSATRQRNRPEIWLFPDLRTKDDLIAAAPARLDDNEKREWADQQYNRDLTALYEAIAARLHPGASLSASFADGELSFAVDGVPIVCRIFVSPSEGEFIAAQWKVIAATFAITEKIDGKKLANALRKLAVADNPAVVQQIITLERQLSAVETDIAQKEAEMNGLVYRLYNLSQADISLIEGEVRHSRPR